jgi:hypothetical protein
MNRPRSRSGAAVLMVLQALALAALVPCTARGVTEETPQRICASLESHYYIFDSKFFELGNAFGGGAALRYEIASDVYLENGIGAFTAKGGGVNVDGLDYRLNLFVIVPFFMPVPYRPVARLGVGFLSVNPVTATPTDTYRPTQTAFYVLGGAGITRVFMRRMLVEASASAWITPYLYRIYRFNRHSVTVDTERFTHVAFSLAVTYTF